MTPSERRFSLENAILWSIAWRGRAQLGVLGAHAHVAAVGRVGAEQQAGELGAARAEEPGDADDLALEDLEVDGLDAALAAEVEDLHERRALRLDGVLLGLLLDLLERLELAADHGLDELQLRRLGGDVLADELAVAQDRHAVGDLEDLLEEVRDEHDRDAVGAERAHDLEQLGDLVGVQAGGGLVEDQELGVDVDGAGDRDELLDRDGVRAELRLGVDVEAQAGQGLAGAPVHRAGVDAPEASGAHGRGACSRRPSGWCRG